MDKPSESSIQAEFERFHAASLKLSATEHFQAMSKLFTENKIWKSYAWLLDLAPVNLQGGVAVDIGCKFGHVSPLFLARGARAVIGVDAVDEYLDVARKVVSEIYPQVEFKKSEQGFLPITSNSVDLVLVNEVISHVNPMYLSNLFSEIGRILRVGGYVLISDGNNIANEDCRRDLIDVYDAWENGPPGRKTGRDVVEGAFIDLRRNIIRSREPSLTDEPVEYLAKNTSGLFGEYFLRVIDEFAAGGNFIERPYRRGDCPTNPTESGTVMEFGFYPQQVEMALAAYGIRARQMDPPPQFRRDTVKSVLVFAYLTLRHYAQRWLRPGWYRGASWGFQILGVKER